MIFIIIVISLLFICTRSYVYRFSTFVQTLTNDKHFANMLTPTSMVFLSIFAWIIDICLVILFYLNFGILIAIIFATVVNIIPKFLSFSFPFPNYQSFLRSSKKLIFENTKEEFMNHPEIINALSKIEMYTK